jgi:hypothetical protein
MPKEEPDLDDAFMDGVMSERERVKEWLHLFLTDDNVDLEQIVIGIVNGDFLD